MTAPRANKSLTDGLKCIQWILTQSAPVSLQDLAVALGFETTRAHRLLKTFVQSGFLRQTTGRRYEAGPAIFYLAMQTLHDSHLLEAALPPLEKLRYGGSHKVAMGVLWNRQVSYLYHALPQEPIERAIGGCGMYHATNSGIGIATLARLEDHEVEAMYSGHPTPNFPGGIPELLEHLHEVRETGYAYVTVCGGASCTLALSLPSNPSMAIALAGRITPDEIPALLPELSATIKEIEAAMRPNGPLTSLKSLRERRARDLV